MKRVFISMILVGTIICFAGCGDSGNDVDSTQTNAVTNEQLADTADNQAVDKESADADYNQLLRYVEGLSTHNTMKEELKTDHEKFNAGEITVDDLILAYQQLSDDSNNLLEQLQKESWSTETYHDQVVLLNDTLEALAQAEALNTEALINNDEDKLTEGDTYMNTYYEKMDEFLTSMGV